MRHCYSSYVLILPSSGKQARNFNDDQSRKNDPSVPQQPQPVQQKAMPASEPLYGHHLPPQQPHDAYSEAPLDGQNRVAQAGHAAAHHAEADQELHAKNSKSSKRLEDVNLAQIIAEENASKSKFPRYPGLERWTLMEKMGDGAFSNVYRARDTTGEYGEVAIKVVRKYEMNSMQVRGSTLSLLSFLAHFLDPVSTMISALVYFSCFILPTQGVAPT